MKSAKYLVVISVDAMNKCDYDYIQSLATFKTFFKEGAHSKDVTSVYPTVTYTCHTSLGTGQNPEVHGIYNNELPQPQKPTKQDWHWYEKDIKSPTLFDYATQAGLTTGSVLWPVMAGANTNYNVPEIWSPDASVSSLKLFWRYGTHKLIWPVIKYSKLLKGTQQPYLDIFSKHIATHIIKKYQPNLMAIHFTDLDTMRHLYGLNSQQAKGALARIDQHIADIIALYQELGIHEETNYVLLGDHGTHDFTKVVELNTYFKEQGLLSTDSDGMITNWKAYACTSGGSAQIHLAPDADDTVRSKLLEVIDKLIVMPKSPVKQVLTRSEASEQYNLSGDFDYVLEAKDDFVFRNTVTDRFIYDGSDYSNGYIGDHGYLPEHEDMKTLLLMKGPSIEPGAILDHSNLIDEGPTLAKLLGLTMENTSGIVLSQLLKP